MKINIKTFVISLAVMLSVPLLIISIWTRLSLSFGREFMDFFNSIHPHPFRATFANLKLYEHLIGVSFDLFYILVDTIIFCLGFGLLYNWLNTRNNGKQAKK
jgi:hypothetical protein